MLDVEKLTKRYGHVIALDNVSFHVKKGDIFGFLGPNGAGKTTTIRILTTILKYDSGKVEIDGHDVSQDPDYVKSIINSLPESFRCYDWMTAQEYLGFFAKLYGVQPEINKLLNDVGLDSNITKPIGTYSHGMKQRLGIARALVNSPKLIILDEPTSGLDPIGRREIHNLLLHINKTKGTTIFLSTHLLDDVERLCNRIAIINKGKIIKEGSLSQLKKKESLEKLFFKLISPEKPT
jgi:ABC-2 type transport system ATP-binding protein